jgi:CBS domain-containing protein
MRIRDMLATKGPAVVTVAPWQTVRDAMNLLVQHRIGAVVVYDNCIRGILSERDILRAAAADPRQLETTSVKDLMTKAVITLQPDAPIRSAMDVMTERRIRHLPIVEDGMLCGIISIGDVVHALRQSVEEENRHLYAYIYGVSS